MGNSTPRESESSSTTAQETTRQIVIGNFKMIMAPLIARGVSADVHKGYHKYRNIPAAAKHYELTYLSCEERTKIEKMSHNELETLKKLQKHPNVVELYEYIIKENSIWIVMEFCDQKNLSTYLEKHPELSFLSRAKIMKQAGSAIAYMHSQYPPIIHRDIKPENILVKTENGKDTVKIADFGISKVYLKVKEVKMKMTLCGTEDYMAPELFVKLYDNSNLEYTESVDIFSMGLVFLVVLQYESNNKQLKPKSVQAKQNNRNAPFGFELYQCNGDSSKFPTLFDNIDKTDPLLSDLQKLIVNMTENDPRKRPKAKYMEITTAGIYERASQAVSGASMFAACETLSDLVEHEWWEEKSVEVDSRIPIRSVALIRGLLYCCCWGGIHIYTQELEHASHIDARDMGDVCQVTELSAGDVVIAAGTGLYHATHKGQEKSKIFEGYYTSVATHNQDVYAVRRDSSTSPPEVYLEMYTYNGTWHNRNVIRLSCDDYHCVSIIVNDLHIYACCEQEGVIFVMSHDGQVLRTLGREGSDGKGQFCAPRLCHSDIEDALLVADTLNHRLQLMDAEERWSLVDTKPWKRLPLCALYTTARVYVAFKDNILRLYRRA